ncbi:uncharacterized protein BJX67DRAFT_346626 [Aspergillus lucknowensis]|uniref:BTB domain-containing protein n=1 Tax=Aspergillus lucknowensis TaxID=176173 RepID=A0ABR4M017_9EURO
MVPRGTKASMTDTPRVMQSGMVDFIIGKNRKRFWIHSALAGYIPKKILDRPVNDEMDEVDFGRCCEFAYCGNYSVPLPISRLHQDGKVEPTRTPRKRWNPTYLSNNIFYTTSIGDYKAHLVEQLGLSTWDRNERDGLTDPANDYTEVFLVHARMHRVAHQTDWTLRRDLSLYRLTWLLENFTLSDDRAGNIVSLLRFVFVESEPMKDIRKLLCDYATWNVEVLMRDVEFQKLLDAVPSLEKVIFRSMWM